jgi:undecaprenyl-diphosphatase
MEQLAAIVMGLVEGITEFLPISSTGHLILTDHLLGFKELVGDKEIADAFKIIIQSGAILAVVAAYPRRFTRLLRFRENQGFSGLRGIGLLVITSIPAGLLGLAADKYIEENLFGRGTVAAALAAGAVWILLVEHWRPRTRTEGVDSLTWKEALTVGLFQCVALWPGMSRSASTILGGMLAGVERKTATEYSFFAAVPIMLTATAYKLYKTYSVLNASHAVVFAIGFVVSFFSAWAAVRLFVRFLSRHTLVPFAWYRMALAALVVWWLIARPSIPPV